MAGVRPRATAWREMDEDGAVVSVGNTGLYTEVYRYVPNRDFVIDRASVTLFDLAALPLLRWRICVNGNPVAKLQDLRTFCFQGAQHDVNVGETTFPLAALTIEVLNPVASGVAFDVCARLTGRDTR